jgi:hypothetical protein
MTPLTQVAYVTRPAVLQGELRLPSGLERGIARLQMFYSGALYAGLRKLLPFAFTAPSLLGGLLSQPERPYSQVFGTLKAYAAAVVAVAIAAAVGMVAALIRALHMARTLVPAA